MTTRTERVPLQPVILLVLFLTYFVVFPEDLAALLAPLEMFLGLTRSVPTSLYGLLAVALICWTAQRIWGRRSATN